MATKAKQESNIILSGVRVWRSPESSDLSKALQYSQGFSANSFIIYFNFQHVYQEAIYTWKQLMISSCTYQ